MLSESRNTVGSCIPKELRDECSDHGSPCCPRPVVATLQRRISLCRGNAISALRPQARARAQASSRQHTLAHKFHFATDECIWLGRRRRSATHGFAFDAGQKKPRVEEKKREEEETKPDVRTRAERQREGVGFDIKVHSAISPSPWSQSPSSSTRTGVASARCRAVAVVALRAVNFDSPFSHSS